MLPESLQSIWTVLTAGMSTCLFGSFVQQETELSTRTMHRMQAADAVTQRDSRAA